MFRKWRKKNEIALPMHHPRPHFPQTNATIEPVYRQLDLQSNRPCSCRPGGTTPLASEARPPVCMHPQGTQRSPRASIRPEASDAGTAVLSAPPAG